MKFTVVIDLDLKELAVEYLANRRTELPQLLDLLKSQDYKKICDIAHRMKGNAKTYGFSDLTDCGGDLEKAAQVKNEEDCRKIAQKIQNYLSNIEIQFESVA